MRPIAVLLVGFALLTNTGCAFYDALFSAFGDHYTAGGYDQHDRKAHYDAEVQKWEDYDRYGS